MRAIYGGPLTYSANWDDVDDTIILGALDVIGINAFYPSGRKSGAGSPSSWREDAVLRRAFAVCRRRGTSRCSSPSSATRRAAIPRCVRGNGPTSMSEWWSIKSRKPTLIAGCSRRSSMSRRFLGFFVWRVYADPDDVSQEVGVGVFAARQARPSSWCATRTARDGSTTPPRPRVTFSLAFAR